jgi:hypothetical protein
MELELQKAKDAVKAASSELKEKEQAADEWKTKEEAAEKTATAAESKERETEDALKEAIAVRATAEGAAKEQSKQAESVSQVAKEAVEELAKAREQIAAQSASLEIAHKEADVLTANVKAAEEGKVETEKVLVAKTQEAEDTGHELTGARDKAEAQEQVAEFNLEKNQMKLSAAESKVDTLQALLDALQKRTLEMEARAERDAAKAGMLTHYRNRPHQRISEKNAGLHSPPMQHTILRHACTTPHPAPDVIAVCARNTTCCAPAIDTTT